MNAIMGMTELALGTNLSEEQREYLDIVSQASKSLLKLLNDILDFSKVEAGKLVLETKPFELRKSLGEMVKTLALQAHEKELELVYYIDSEVPDHLIGDVGRLRQIVVNLIGNAIKFTEIGEIVLKIDVLEDEIDDKILLHFIVSDTGIGIPEDRLNFIFEKFAQADSSNTRKYGGTGLGLAISAKLVELMGGVIWAESPTTFPHSNPVGPGSTFHFTGLFKIGDQKSERKDKEAIAKLKGLSVLIVDDNETNRRFLQEILAKNGLRPETAHSGSEALELLQSENRTFQMVVLDFQMPEMNGGTVLKKIRHELMNDVPVVLITSGVKTEDILEIKSQKLSTHLLKPVSSQELFDVMLKVMGYKHAREIAPPVAEATAPEIPDETYMNVLVAEDNAINQRLIRRLLEKEGHHVDIACDGMEAVKTFVNQTQENNKLYHLILMDIQMPNMDGMEATREIRQINKEIPIIALTAHAMKGDKGKFLAGGMNDYVSKPIDRKILFNAIAKHVNPLHPHVRVCK
jgi:CheY-like chemotaxis protein